MLCSVIIPVFNEEDVLPVCYRRLTETLQKAGGDYELLFVNDGSQDGTAAILRLFSKRDAHVKVIHFTRNFGHQNAITAGMRIARGRTVVVIDADLQDPPELILDMLSKWREGYEVVYARRISREGESWFKKQSAALFYRLINQLTDVPIPLDVGDFRLIDQKVCRELNQLHEKNRFVRGLVSWLGFKETYIDYVREKRFAGTTKYPLRKMIRLSIHAITSLSYKPLRFASLAGLFMSALSFLLLAVFLYFHFFSSRTLPGWTSIVVISLFFHGITLTVMGIMGEYIGRIYEESKNRPSYIVTSIDDQDVGKVDYERV